MKIGMLAFSGQIRSGKSTLSQAVAEQLTCPRASFGDHVRKLANLRGLDGTRKQLQDLGESLVESDAKGFCDAVLGEAGWTSGELIVVDGVRHPQVLALLRETVAPQVLRLIYVDTDDETRQQRHDQLTGQPSPLDEAERHSTERDVAKVLRLAADRIVSGSRPVDEVAAAVVAWFDEGGPASPQP